MALPCGIPLISVPPDEPIRDAACLEGVPRDETGAMRIIRGARLLCWLTHTLNHRGETFGTIFARDVPACVKRQGENLSRSVSAWPCLNSNNKTLSREQTANPRSCQRPSPVPEPRTTQRSPLLRSQLYAAHPSLPLIDRFVVPSGSVIRGSEVRKFVCTVAGICQSTSAPASDAAFAEAFGLVVDHELPPWRFLGAAFHMLLSSVCLRRDDLAL